MGLSKASRLTTLRLFHDYFIGETATIGCDYSSWNAATIADLYWLSGESPKRDTAAAANGSALPCQANARLIPCQVWEASRPRRAGMVCDMLHCLAWIHNKGAHRCTLIYLIIIGRLRWPVQRPAWRRRCGIAGCTRHTAAAKHGK